MNLHCVEQVLLSKSQLGKLTILLYTIMSVLQVQCVAITGLTKQKPIKKAANSMVHNYDCFTSPLTLCWTGSTKQKPIKKVAHSIVNNYFYFTSELVLH